MSPSSLSWYSAQQPLLPALMGRTCQVHNCEAMTPTLHIPHQGGGAASEVVSRRLLLGLGRRAQLAVRVRVPCVTVMQMPLL